LLFNKKSPSCSQGFEFSSCKICFEGLSKLGLALLQRWRGSSAHFLTMDECGPVMVGSQGGRVIDIADTEPSGKGRIRMLYRQGARLLLLVDLSTVSISIPE
jgi:hypothetical protein